jgi:DNA-binding transcriptional LysR family regulator
VLEVRLLRSFAVVAELGSFTEAARHLHISQPALSQQIKALEHTLRTPLFVRSAGPTRLTPAGEHLLRHAYRVLTAVDDTADAMLGLASGGTGRLRVGVVVGGFWDILHPVLRSLAATLPDARFRVRQIPSQEQLAAVRQGDVEVALYRRIAEEPEDGLVLRPLRDDPLIAVVADGHPALRPDGTINLADLAGEHFVAFRRVWMPLTYDRCLAACHEAGFTPAIAEHCEDPLTLAFAVAGGAVALTGAGQAGRYPGLAYAPVTPARSIAEVSLVWRQDADNPLLPVFVEQVVAHCGDPVRYWRAAYAPSPPLG